MSKIYNIHITIQQCPNNVHYTLILALRDIWPLEFERYNTEFSDLYISGNSTLDKPMNFLIEEISEKIWSTLKKFHPIIIDPTLLYEEEPKLYFLNKTDYLNMLHKKLNLD